MTSIFDKIKEVSEAALVDIESSDSLQALDLVRVKVLGKKGALSEVLKGLGQMSAEDRPKVGAASNEWKAKIEAALSLKKTDLEDAHIQQEMEKQKLDVTMPSRKLHSGSLHPITTTTRKIVNILGRIGFDVATGPEAELDYYCFEAVNIPKDHPARDMQDTFFLSPSVVMRTHTTPVQMRVMREQKPPIRILAPGAVYRSDSDATHLPMFHQVEGLWVDKGVKFSDLKGVLDFLAKELFGSKAKIRLRPSYFPFVEPGAEVDISCVLCEGKRQDCPMCRGSGWLEILGAGMVHPKLFEEAQYDAKELTGFAFGLGVERVAMLLHGIPDLRLMVQGDLRFLKQFQSVQG